MAGQRVVLVEGDLRRPLIAQRLELDGAVGTTNVLIGKVALVDALQEYATRRAAGPRVRADPAQPVRAAPVARDGDLLVDLRGKFDVVIVDAPPLLPVTDAALIAAQADGAVIVIRHGRTTRDQLQHSIERLEAVDAKALGVVINQAPSRKNRTGYGYGYGYGYGFESEAEVDSKRSRREATAVPATAQGDLGSAGPHVGEVDQRREGYDQVACSPGARNLIRLSCAAKPRPVIAAHAGLVSLPAAS